MSSQAVFSIAGSDPSGGAGIQADLKTFTAIGVYGAAAITCLTAQNSQGVAATQPVAPDFVKRQIELVLADLPVSHIKTGMLGNDAIASAIAEALAGFDGELICDPVLKASDGHPLFTAGTGGAGLTALLKKATILTPNLPEIEALTGSPCASPREALAAAQSLLTDFTNLRAIVLTGGHLQEERPEVEDYLVCRNRTGVEIIPARHERICTRNTHGTGCTFASAFAAYHLLCGNDREAFAKAVAFLDSLLRQSVDLDLGKGKGPMAHHLFRKSGEM